jgi:hypothetical protein
VLGLRVWVFFVDFVLLPLPSSLLEKGFCLSQSFIVFLLHLFLILNIRFVVTDAFVETITVKAALDSQREAGEAAKFGKLEEMYFFISLYLGYVDVFLLYWLRLTLFKLLDWFFLFKDFIRATGFVGENLSDHKLMRFGRSHVLNNFGIFRIKFSPRLKIVLFQLLVAVLKFTHIASSQSHAPIVAHTFDRVGQ